MMTEMGQHTREIKTGYPFPGVLVLARTNRLRRGKRKDPASQLRQSWRADHVPTHGLRALPLTVREVRPRHPSISADACCKLSILSRLAAAVTVSLHRPRQLWRV